jgi:hypothetical protein
LIIDIATFRLAPGVDDAAFLDVDARVQAELMRGERAFVRRTTARGEDGTWLVLTFWWTEPSEQAGLAGQELQQLVEGASLRRETYVSID